MYLHVIVANARLFIESNIRNFDSSDEKSSSDGWIL